MNNEQALALLGLKSGATDLQIDAAFQQKKAQAEQKLESAPTDALKEKFREMSQQLEDARKILLATPSVQTPAQDHSGPSLSTTKLADLPNAGCCGQPKPDTLLSTFSNSMGVTSPNVVCSRREL